MKRTVLFTLLLCLVSLGVLAMSKRQSQINAIKKSSDYLYADVTMPTLEQATAQAYEQLGQAIQEWTCEQGGSKADTVSAAFVRQHADTIMVRRADMYRVFAFVRKSVFSPKNRGQHDTLLNDTARQFIMKQFFGRRGDTLNRIRKARNFFELKEIMEPLKAQGTITGYGKYATAEHPEDCYLIVYDAAGNIKALLGKGTETRPNLKTGKEDSLQNYRGCGAIWFTMNE